MKMQISIDSITNPGRSDVVYCGTEEPTSVIELQRTGAFNNTISGAALYHVRDLPFIRYENERN